MEAKKTERGENAQPLIDHRVIFRRQKQFKR